MSQADRQLGRPVGGTRNNNYQSIPNNGAYPGALQPVHEYISILHNPWPELRSIYSMLRVTAARTPNAIEFAERSREVFYFILFI